MATATRSSWSATRRSTAAWPRYGTASPEQHVPVLDALVQHVGITEHRVKAAVRVATHVPGGERRAHHRCALRTGRHARPARRRGGAASRAMGIHVVCRADRRDRRISGTHRPVAGCLNCATSSSEPWSPVTARRSPTAPAGTVSSSGPATSSSDPGEMRDDMDADDLRVARLRRPDSAGPLDRMSPWLDIQTRQRRPRPGQARGADGIADSSRRTRRSTGCRGRRVTYLCVGRDPRDVAISWDHHLDNMDIERCSSSRHALGSRPRRLLATDPGRPGSDGRALPDLGRSTPRPNPSPGTRTHAPSPREPSGTAAGGQRDAVPLRRAPDRSGGADAPPGRAARHLGSRRPLAAARRGHGRSSTCANTPTRIAPGRPTRSGRTPSSSSTAAPAGNGATLLDDDDVRRYYERVAELADPDLVRWVRRDPPAP